VRSRGTCISDPFRSPFTHSIPFLDPSSRPEPPLRRRSGGTCFPPGSPKKCGCPILSLLLGKVGTITAFGHDFTRRGGRKNSIARPGCNRRSKPPLSAKKSITKVTEESERVSLLATVNFHLSHPWKAEKVSFSVAGPSHLSVAGTVPSGYSPAYRRLAGLPFFAHLPKRNSLT
jgi:hypothetical protein